MTQLDWAALQQNAKGQLEPIPAGEYGAKVIDATAVQSSTGKPMIKTKYELTEGPHAPRKVMTQFVVSDDNPMALAIFFRQMEAHGLDSNFFAQNPSMEQVASAMISRPVRITLAIKAWQGVDRNEVKAVNPPPSGGPVGPGVATGPAALLPTPGATPAQTAAPAIPTPNAVAPTPGPTPPAGGPPPLPI